MRIFPLLFVLSLSFISVPAARADVFDRIDQCERGGGGACVYDLLRELARNHGGGGHGPALLSGTYRSESYSIQVEYRPGTLVISGSDSISERGTYSCSGSICSGSYSIEILSPTSFKVTYGSNGTRTWTKN